MEKPVASAEFVQLLTSHQREIFRFIGTFLPRHDDVEEVLQETNALLWSRSDQFQPGTSFGAWARQVARYKVIEFCRKNVARRQVLDPDLLETVASEYDEAPDANAIQLDSLRSCLEKLSVRDRSLIDGRYSSGLSVKQLAEESQRPLNSVYRSLDRIRLALLACIERAIREEGRS